MSYQHSKEEHYTLQLLLKHFFNLFNQSQSINLPLTCHTGGAYSFMKYNMIITHVSHLGTMSFALIVIHLVQEQNQNRK